MTVGPTGRPDRDGRAAGQAAGTVQLAAPERRTAKLAAVPQAASTASAARPPRNGSWWPVWEGWLAAHSSGRVPPPPLGAADVGYRPLAEAPGTYVLQR